MYPLSIVASVTGLISVSNAIISTLYDIERTTRSATESVEALNILRNSLRNSLRPFEQAIKFNKDLLEQREDRPETCARILSLPSNVEATCWQLVRSKDSRGWLTRYDDSRGREYTRSMEETCTKLMHCVQLDGLNDPVLWKLQRWILRWGERILLSVRIRLPEAIRRPSPTLLLATWVVTALAVVAYYETQPGYRYRTTFLLGGALVGTVVGVTEGSSVDTMILTNMPWCIALGILLDVLMYRLVGGKSRKSREQDSSSIGAQHWGGEKAILA